MEEHFLNYFTLEFFGRVESEAFGKSSFFRNTYPDYSLVIRSAYRTTGLDECAVKINDRDFSNEEYDYNLNVGDLFLTAVNLFDLDSRLDDFINDLANKSKCVSDAFVSTKIVNPVGNEFLELYRKFKNANSELALFYSFYNTSEADRKNNECMLFSFIGAAIDDAYEKNDRINTELLKKTIFTYPFLDTINLQMKFNEEGNTIYSFGKFWDAVVFDLHEMLKLKSIICKCENCGKLFIPLARSDEKYCDYTYMDGKSCKQLGYENKVKNDGVLSQYRKIYKTQNARKQRNSHIPQIAERFKAWAEFAKKQLESCQNGEQSLDSMVEAISGDSWMKEGANNADNPETR